MALRAALGEPRAVTSIKGVTGHSLGAAGGLEAVACVLALRHRTVPPTAGTAEVDPALGGLDVVLEGRPLDDGLVLSTSFAFGGHDGALVLGPPP